MLRAVPKSWFSSGYKVLDNNSTVAIVELSISREAGTLTIQGTTYNAYREALLSGAFILEKDGSILARAIKPSAVYRSFQVELEGKKYTLEAESIGRRKFVLSENGVRVGSVSPEHSLTRKSVVDFPQEISLPGRIFLFWLVMIMWKRATDATAAS